ncbi:MAG TPA: 3D-(3,5/4)-trihydroxycyclohexane-1,2-dione acylhydrolase (decyclizing), partial [Mycobacterium sp.]|nr:3D-(3,5/4)-trihydroxycyclohexane-1,2-dione acylhydrolase (decyclizing) [Mycobacterium sp.]
MVSKASVFKTPDTEPTVRLTVAQATIRFLANQYVERDGERAKFFAGCFGIFGHGNVAGLGQALLQAEVEAAQTGTEPALRYVLGRNEQAMVHSAAAYARQKDRLQAWAVTASIGPGSTNMLTGAALATINRLPVLLLPSDTFATRVSAPVLQQLEAPNDGELTVNDAFKPLSRFFDRVWRPEQLPSALLGAMRVLTDPVETGAATIAMPQDVQAEAYDWPESLFAERTWHIARPVPERSVIARAAEVIRSAQRPLIVAGGGVIYSGASDVLAAFAEATGVPVSETQAGKGSLHYDHPQAVGAIGSTGTTAANALAAEADVVIGIGTRYSDFTSASRTAFNDPGVRFVNINVASFDAVKQGGLCVVADAREAVEALSSALVDHSVNDEYRAHTAQLGRDWADVVSAAYRVENDGSALNQSQVIGLVNTLSDPRDVVVCAAGSMPGDLHKMWRTRDRKGYHVEYGYSCMGYEVAGGIGISMASPDRDVFVMVGDGSYLMMATELVTAVQEGVKVIVVLVQNHGFAS